MYRIPKGAKKTIWRIELNATRTAQSVKSNSWSERRGSHSKMSDSQSESPPAMSVHTNTIATHRLIPMRITPVLNSVWSGRKAHASPNMRRGAKIQLMKSENPRWYQMAFPEKSLRSDEGETRHRMGHIIRMRAMAAME